VERYKRGERRGEERDGCTRGGRRGEEMEGL
jgi:hypothetical protein